MLDLRPACERCAAPLPPSTPDAHICSFECTWCAACATGRLGFRCPNCGGALRPRPPRAEPPSAAPPDPPDHDPLDHDPPRVLHAAALLRLLPRPATETWPDGVPFAVGLTHGSMSVELYAPVAIDRQTPHDRDEIYVIERGQATLRIGQTAYAVGPGDVAFVRAGEDHRFEEFVAGFATWVLFWGPIGGEQ